MNAGNNLSQQKSRISIQRGLDQKTNAGAGIPMVEQHQPHCCLNPQTNYGYCLPQGQGPPQNGAILQQQITNQANPNMCAYCHCQCHYQHPAVPLPPSYPICYQQTSPQGTSRSFVSSSPSPYQMATAGSTPVMPFNPLMQPQACIPTFTTSYTYPAAAGSNQQPNTSAYHMYVSTTAINVDDPRAAGLKAIKSIHEATSDSQGVTSDSSSERLTTTRPGWKWDSVPASSDNQRPEAKIPSDEYKNQNGSVRQTSSVSSKKFGGSNNAGSVISGKKGTGSSNKKIEITKENGSSIKVSNSYAKDGNSYVREGDSYARPATYTVRDDQTSLRSGGRRVSISSNPPTKAPSYSAPFNKKDETTDRTENNRISEGVPSKTLSARQSGAEKIKSAVRRSKKNESSSSIGKENESVEDKNIVKYEESYVEDVEEVPDNAIVPLEDIQEVGNEYLAEDSATGASSNNEEYQENPAVSAKREIQEDRDLFNNIGDQNVGLNENEINNIIDKARDNDSDDNKSELTDHSRKKAFSDRGSYQMSTTNLLRKEPGIVDNGIPQKGRDNDSEKSEPKSLSDHSRKKAFSDRGSYQMSTTNLLKGQGIIDFNALPEKGRDKDSDNRTKRKSFGTYSGKDTNKPSNVRDRGSYEAPKIILNNEPGNSDGIKLSAKSKADDNERKSVPKSQATNSGKDSKRQSGGHGRRGSYKVPKANLNKVLQIDKVNELPQKGRNNDSEKSEPTSLSDHSRKKAFSDRGSYQMSTTDLLKEVNATPEKGRDTDNEGKVEAKPIETISGMNSNRSNREFNRGSYEMSKSNNSITGPIVSQKNIQPNRVVSEVERAVATQTSGIPLPTKTIPVDVPKTGATGKSNANVVRRSVDEQSQTGKFPRKKTLEMLSKLSMESFDKLISSFVGISLYDKDERVADLINAILESAEPEMEGSSTFRGTFYIPPQAFRDDDNDDISATGGSSKYKLPGGFQHRKNEGTTFPKKPEPNYKKNLSPPKRPISSNARKASVNNIIQEFSNNRKFDDTLSNIKETFPGEKIDDFVGTLSKQAEKMTDEKEIEQSGRLVRLLIGNRDISKKEAISVISSALVDLPQNLEDSPMAATSTAQYLTEIFSEESNFDWLFQIGMKLIQTDDAKTNAAWRDLSINTLKMLKSKNNEK